MRAQLVHLNGPFRGRTITYGKHRLVFGTSPDADIRYTPAWSVVDRHAELSLEEEECEFHLKALDGTVFVNQQQVAEVILRDEDLIELGRDGPKLRFRAYAEEGRTCKPVRQMLRDARDVGDASGVFTMSKALTGDLLKRSTSRFRILFPVVLLALVFGVAYLGGWLGGRRTARKQQEEQAQIYEKEFARLAEQIEAFASREEVAGLRADLERRARVVDDLVARNAALKEVLEKYSRGVCLIYGAYTFKAKGKPVRDPQGKPLELEYVGSGFLASAAGDVVTNRHVASPWWHNSAVAPLLQRGFKPEFVRLLACFPGQEPIPVDPAGIRLSPDGVDIAVLRVDVKNVPVLPLEAGDVGALRGERVVLLGYPTGINAILARSEPDLVRAVLGRSKDTTTLVTELAKEKAIQPVITQGALNEVRARRLVYDAETTSGGSGGPVFASNGKVIGVNFAITRDFDGSNFGVPIEFARKMLP